MTLDTQLFLALNSLVGHSGILDGLIVFCGSYLAYIVGILFIGIVVFGAYPRREKWEILFAALLAALLARGVVTEIIRFFYHRPRPFTALGTPHLIGDSAWSFPSGHATFFFGVSTVLYLYDRRLGVWFLAGSVVITVARVVAGVHYPSDILAGALIGGLCAVAAVSAVRRWGPKVVTPTY